MGLDFSKTKTQSSAMTTTADTKNEIEVVETYDIVEDRQQMNQMLVGSQEVDNIVSTIEIDNLETIVSFGAEVAEEISKASDVVLNNVNMSQLDDSSEMLNALARVMEKFDIDELLRLFNLRLIFSEFHINFVNLVSHCMVFVQYLVKLLSHIAKKFIKQGRILLQFVNIKLFHHSRKGIEHLTRVVKLRLQA